MPKRPLSITFILLLFICGTAHAQVSMGLEAGVAFPKLLNELQGYNAYGASATMNTQSVTRFYGGFLADIPLEKKQFLIIRPSFLYLGAGGKTPQLTDFNGNLIQAQMTYDFDYVEMPLQLLYSPSLPFGKPWLGGGIYGAAMFNASAGSNNGPVNIGSGPGDNVKRFDLGYAFTAGITFKCGLLLGVDYQQSFGGIVPNAPAGSQPVRNSVWGVHLGFMSNAGGGSHAH